MIQIDRTLTASAALALIPLANTAKLRDARYLEHELIPQLGLSGTLALPARLKPFADHGARLAGYPHQLAAWWAWLQQHQLRELLFIGGDIAIHAATTLLLRQLNPLLEATYAGQVPDQQAAECLAGAGIVNLGQDIPLKNRDLVVLADATDVTTLVNYWQVFKNTTSIITLLVANHDDYPAQRELWQNLRALYPARQLLDATTLPDDISPPCGGIGAVALAM